MKTCYIAGKIGDLPEAVYKAAFEAAEAEVRLMGYEPVNPCKLPHNHSRTWLQYMLEDISALMRCDAIYVMENWHDSVGAAIEVRIASERKMAMYFPMALNVEKRFFEDVT